MKRITPIMAAAAAATAVFAVSPATADEIPIPNHAPTTAGNGAYTTLFHNQARSYQLVVGPEELGAIAPGSTITAITWRRPSWIVYANWPGTGSTCTFQNFDVFLSTSLNPPGSLSTSYLDNIAPDVVQVLDGPLMLSGPHFPGGALSPGVNPFGDEIPLQTPWVYPGGDLLLTVRHTGNNCPSGGMDTLFSPYHQALGVSSYTQPDMWYNQGLITMKLTFTPPAACPADVNGDNAVNVFDLLAVLAAWGPCPGCPEDITGDGTVNVFDLLEVLGAWGPCP